MCASSKPRLITMLCGAPASAAPSRAPKFRNMTTLSLRALVAVRAWASPPAGTSRGPLSRTASISWRIAWSEPVARPRKSSTPAK